MSKEVKQEQDEPVGKFAKFNDGIWREVTVGSSGVLLYTHPKAVSYTHLPSPRD